MKAAKLFIFATLLLPLHLLAKGSDSTTKAYFYNAKQHLENMLSGKEPLSYEKAIYEIENAWWENKFDYSAFSSVLDYHTNEIRSIIKARYEKRAYKSDYMQPAEQKKIAYERALANYAIFTYMTDTSYTLKNGKTNFVIQHTPFRYSSYDPLGTNDWTNTQVVKLLETGQGNCFTLASLFKIFSDRLQSDATLCTAPSHIYIHHADEKETIYNIEVASKAFPGTGTIETLTYTTGEATKNNIALRELDIKQSIALCLVYLAKGYEYKFNDKDNDFVLQCAETALQYDDHNLNAMLLKAEFCENKLVKQHKDIKYLQKQKDFQDYQKWIVHIFSLGYKEMPFEMKNMLIKGWTRDTTIQLSMTDHTPKRLTNSNVQPTRYASLSWGLFDEEIKTNRTERIGNTVLDTKAKKIVSFLPSDVLYNQYNFDPIVFALNVDPLAHKMPGWSPYASFADNPILNTDPNGAFPWSIHIRSFISAPTVGGGLFLGDGRGAMLATDKTVTSRVRSNFVVDPAKQTISAPSAVSDPSVFLGAGTPGMPGYLPPDVEVGKPHASIDKANFANGYASFDFSHSGKDPITPQWATPALDLHASISLKENLDQGTLDINGSFTGDKFPSSEAFIVDQSGKVKVFLGAEREQGGVKDLYGDNHNPLFNVNMQIQMDKNGNFTGVKQGDKTYSVDDWNKNVQQQFNNGDNGDKNSH